MASLFQPIIPNKPGKPTAWAGLRGPSLALALANAALRENQLFFVITDDARHAVKLEEELKFFLGNNGHEVAIFPDWETLPYDVFSPLPELISERLSILNKVSSLNRGIILCSTANLIQKICPKVFVNAHSFELSIGQKINFNEFLKKIEQAGYRAVSQVFSHGEFAVRGALIDIFPMGANDPIRIDLFDDEIESIRVFSADTQLTKNKISEFSILPANEFPLDSKSITNFRKNWRGFFSGNPKQSLIYKNISENSIPGGIEYYLPLFFEKTESFLTICRKKQLL